MFLFNVFRKGVKGGIAIYQNHPNIVGATYIFKERKVPRHWCKMKNMKLKDGKEGQAT